MTHARRAASLPVRFFQRPAEQVARDLLGCAVTSRVGGKLTRGRIVETEAYTGEHDAASHGYRLRRDARNASLFEAPGTWYVYLSYGVHWCANLVCEAKGRGAAVLLRALEPLDGIEVMRERRGGAADRLLCSGPGRLCQALGIDLALDGGRMPQSEVIVEAGRDPAQIVIAESPRIGITRAVDVPLRFTVAESRWLSRRT